MLSFMATFVLTTTKVVRSTVQTNFRCTTMTRKLMTMAYRLTSVQL